MDMLTLLVSALLPAVWLSISVNGWDYPEGKENGWDGVCRTGSFQSPIDIPAGSKGVLPAAFEPLVFVNYDKLVQYNVTNNGHTAVLKAVDSPCDTALAGGGLRKLYKLDHLHFHWGSEHMVNGVRYPLELHLVHYDSNYPSLEEAVGKHGGLAVLAVLFRVSLSDVPNPEIGDVLAGVRFVAKGAGVQTKLGARFSAGMLIPTDVNRFWRYWGSLTTPTCNEGVIWTVLEDTLPVAPTQVNEFRKMLHGTEQILKNYREPQPINQRIVFYQDPSHVKDAASARVPTLGVVALLTVAGMVALCAQL